MRITFIESHPFELISNFILPCALCAKLPRWIFQCGKLFIWLQISFGKVSWQFFKQATQLCFECSIFNVKASVLKFHKEKLSMGMVRNGELTETTAGNTEWLENNRKHRLNVREREWERKRTKTKRQNFFWLNKSSCVNVGSWSMI